MLNKKVGIFAVVIVIVLFVAGLAISIVNRSNNKDTIEQEIVEATNVFEDPEETSTEAVSTETTSEVDITEEDASQDESFAVALSEAYDRVREEINTEGVEKAEPLTIFEMNYLEHQHGAVDKILITDVQGIYDPVAVTEINYVFVANGYEDYDLVETYYDEMNDEWTYTMKFDDDYWFITSNGEKAYSLKDEYGAYLEVQSMEESENYVNE